MPKDSEYKKYISFKSIFYFCSLPIRVDSCRGCTHGCLYCFSQRLNNRPQGFHDSVVPANPNRFRKYLNQLNSYTHPEGLVKSCLRKRVPIHFGCVSDPFPYIEKEKQITLGFLQVLVSRCYLQDILQAHQIN